jgi:hypothetical protein
VDADIAKVMVDIYDKDIVALTVHALFIVRQGFSGDLKQPINAAFQKVVNATPNMKSASYVIAKDDWLLRKIEDALVSKDQIMNIAMVNRELCRNHGLRIQQWLQVWGLEGLDRA